MQYTAQKQAAVARDRKEDSNEIAVHCARVNGNLGHKMENYDSSIQYATGCEVHLVVCSCPERPTCARLRPVRDLWDR